ncbi:hypothetical protein BWD42_21755 [Sphingobacterium sp. CZ-UAM]|nr:hypothetical protein BWD42_21755 [Sphingobacterium sp. CZ-UAM]
MLRLQQKLFTLYFDYMTEKNKKIWKNILTVVTIVLLVYLLQVDIDDMIVKIKYFFSLMYSICMVFCLTLSNDLDIDFSK